MLAESGENYIPTRYRLDLKNKWLIEVENNMKDDPYLKDRKMYVLNDKPEYKGSFRVGDIVDNHRVLTQVYHGINNSNNYSSSFVMNKKTGSYLWYSTNEIGSDLGITTNAFIETGKCKSL
jgi:hypothetical protein